MAKVDYSYIPARQDSIHLRLEKWAMWCSVSTPSYVHPMFRMYQSKARQWEMPVIRVQASPLDNLEVERAVQVLPSKHRDAIRWAYVWPWVPANAIRRKLGVTQRELLDLIVDARDMVKNRLGERMVER